MSKKLIYLAGPILGCTAAEAQDWRKYICTQLSLKAIGELVGISPLRCEPLIGERYTANYPDPKFGTARAIGAKNMYDVRNCDLTFAYLPKPEAGRSHSLGTIIEIGWAHGQSKPVIIVTNDPFIQNHPVINTCAGWILPTLDDGIDVVIGLLDGYVGGKNV